MTNQHKYENFRFELITIIVLVFTILGACVRPQTPSTPIPPTAVPTTTPSGPDYWPTTGWRTSTPEEQGMDSEMLAKMVEFILKKDYDVHSVTIIRNGYLVADVIIHPYESNSMHQLASATKSITSTLIGIAIQQGHINNVDQSVLGFFPNRTAANLDANKEKMTLEHLLTMSSGFDCSWELNINTNGWSGFNQLDDDWVQYMLDLPMAESPGTRFDYCNSASFLLSAIIQETTGMNTFDYAKQHLFGPLGIDDVVWGANSQGITVGSGGLAMKPHDMAKIGYLFLNEGRWDDTQIISPDWVAASSRKQISGDSDGYGYQWWVRFDGVYYAWGWGEQNIFVIPEHEMVVVFTSNILDGSAPIALVDYTIAAVQSSTLIPPNPDGLELLNSKITQAARDQTETEPVLPLPDIAQIVSGQTYILDPNPLDIKSVSVTFPGESEALLDLKIPLYGSPFNVDPQDTRTDMELPVGLDNIFRFSPGALGITRGMKGAWVSDETFVINADNIGHIGRDRLEFTFIGEKIILEIDTLIRRRTTSINGRLEE